ncbi:hypothetical protein NKR23_g2848 [Pleurostoma richardsiae]|uniref:Spp2/MOS2 G-patch domain-containing protein n=1 Tax=Pleurostoma richardsiae TaxID=41990 RepID=A0AA38RPU5_9PEZI|nr:hypothetical protein NKR23_g2848 [Pleurostoma richardsiae]
MSEGGQSRVAIKFGTSLSNGSSKKASRPPLPSTLGKRQRTHFGADSESEEDDASAGKHQSITGFGANGAETEDDRRRHQSRRDRDYKTDRRRGDGRDCSRESRYRRDSETKEVDLPDEEKPIRWGLTVTKRSTKDRAEAANGDASEPNAPDQGENHEKKVAKNADEEALDALLEKSEDGASKRRPLIPRSESDAYQEAAREAPDVDKLDVYEDYPVDGFGASLLRGQGWDGQMRGPKIKEVQRRPNQMGLGAKKLKGEEDLGGWNQKGGKERRPRLDEYKREKEKERSRREERHRDSYRREREREGDRERDRGGSHRRHERDYR